MPKYNQNWTSSFDNIHLFEDLKYKIKKIIIKYKKYHK